MWDRLTSALRTIWGRWHGRRYWNLGQSGEDVAAKYLRSQRYRIVARGYRDRFGELDLIAVDKRTVVFVEVKTRRTHDTGHPVEAVNSIKQKQLTRLALSFLKSHNLLNHSARFDVVAVTWPAQVSKPQIEHFKNAFEPTGHGQMFS